ncbi:MAG: hypothetical protein HUJ89_06280 [Bacteroidales bacterium]|nr:hypothetical protein [Bacteroidales bacterium]
MNSIVKHLLICISPLLLLLPCSCADKVGSLLPGRQNQLDVSNIRVSEDLRTITVDIEIKSSIDPLILVDSTGRATLRVSESRLGGLIQNKATRPRLVSYTYKSSDSLQREGENKIIMVDPNLPQPELEKIRVLASHLSAVYGRGRVYVTQISNQMRPVLMSVEDAVKKNAFVQNPGEKFLFRSIATLLDYIRPEVAGDSHIIVFSDGVVFDDSSDLPIDPDQLHYEEAILNRMKDKATMPHVSYIQVDEGQTKGEEFQILAKRLTSESGGRLFSEVDLPALSSYFVDRKEGADYEVVLDNPVGKRYYGLGCNLLFEIVRNGETIASGSGAYNVGSVYSEVVVGNPKESYFLNILVLFLILAPLSYILLQCVLPYVRYRRWRAKNVFRYTGPNMAAGGNIVAERCCYCKDDFKEGDEIVAQCKHQMHLECWEDNQCKCPEHGYHNHYSEFFYNRYSITDRRNAPFYATTIQRGIIGGIICMLLFHFTTEWDDGLISRIIGSFSFLSGAADHIFLNRNYDYYILPMYGFCMAFVTTLYLLYVTRTFQRLMHQLAVVIGLSFFVGLVSYFLFLCTSLISMALDIESFSVFVDWIPFTLSSALIMLVLSKNSKIPRKKLAVGALISTFLGLFCLYLSAFLGYKIVTLDMQVVSIIVYFCGMGLTFASKRNSSRQYYLRVSGPVKPMEIAIYKLLRNGEEASLSIGRSVDCEIQINWDTESVIEPIMALVHRKNSRVFLEALEEGVYLQGEAAEVNELLPLHHGDKISIGRTVLTYIEKDVTSEYYVDNAREKLSWISKVSKKLAKEKEKLSDRLSSDKVPQPAPEKEAEEEPVRDLGVLDADDISEVEIVESPVGEDYEEVEEEDSPKLRSILLTVLGILILLVLLFFVAALVLHPESLRYLF